MNPNQSQINLNIPIRINPSKSKFSLKISRRMKPRQFEVGQSEPTYIWTHLVWKISSEESRIHSDSFGLKRTENLLQNVSHWADKDIGMNLNISDWAGINPNPRFSLGWSMLRTQWCQWWHKIGRQPYRSLTRSARTVEIVWNNPHLKFWLVWISTHRILMAF